MNWTDDLPSHLRQSRPVQVLERSLARGRLAHGILLHGDRLEDLEDVALRIARHLLDTHLPAHKHPDCFFVRPVGKSRTIQIGKEERGSYPPGTIRRLIGDIYKTSHAGGNKVGIIVEADRMNTSATNAFLKTLEEPPAGSTLFLLTTRPYDLLDTIRSRCLNFRITHAAATVQHPDWQQWVADYTRWLEQLLTGDFDRRGVARLLFQANGLNLRFQEILEQLTQADLAQLGEAAANLDKEEREALEAGRTRGFRLQRMVELEEVTLHFGRRILNANPDRADAIVPTLAQVVADLEHTVGLLTLNLNGGTALEYFFLRSLRSWTRLRNY